MSRVYCYGEIFAETRSGKVSNPYLEIKGQNEDLVRDKK